MFLQYNFFQAQPVILINKTYLESYIFFVYNFSIAAARDEYKKLSKEKSSEDGHSANDEPPEKKVRVGAGGIAATSMTPQTSSDPTNNANGATGAGQYPNYYYPWSYYGSQQVS